jgi:hypothetical protein
MRRYAGSRALLARSARNLRRAVGTGFSLPRTLWLWPVYPKGKRLNLGIDGWYRLILMTRTELHQLVDALPDESLPAAAILLRRAQDPVAAKLDAAPFDDEELTEEDLRAVKEARSEPGISWSDAEAELSAG